MTKGYLASKNYRINSLISEHVTLKYPSYTPFNPIKLNIESFQSCLENELKPITFTKDKSINSNLIETHTWYYKSDNDSAIKIKVNLYDNLDNTFCLKILSEDNTYINYFE
ncbi:hypothetical protein VSO92_14430 [Myroides pelagicus]|uniref:hypothetical protein n=1 Tax=Myroides TaxID=76831 RepID=UPI0007420322|nr:MULTISPECIES: hypothetical protein [Myroides]KUF46471.1 hypothetical protein AS361_04875 [Myroides marinus]MEC4115293.1 hypothetical protein [Myroides pelagicus]